MSEQNSDKAQKSNNLEKFKNIESGVNKGPDKKNDKDNGSSDSNAGFIQYMINPEKIDKLIASIDNYTISNAAMITKLDNVIDIMEKSNKNQEKSLSLLTQLVNRFINENEEKEKYNNKNDS